VLKLLDTVSCPEIVSFCTLGAGFQTIVSAGLIVSSNSALVTERGVPESVAARVKRKLPVERGVPVSSPEVSFSRTPGGSLPCVSCQSIGGVPPLAVSWKL